MSFYPRFSWLFWRVFDRHNAKHRNSDYEVCRRPLCWLVWRLEWLLWWRGM